MLIDKVMGIKKAAEKISGLFNVWWRRGELNPRPPALVHQLYMLSFVF